MAVVTNCPVCGRKVALPSGFSGGSATCSHADCAHVFQVQADAPKMSSIAPTGLKPAEPRVKGSRPELLDRVPTHFFASPAMYAIGLAVALLYGMVLFGVLSARRNRIEPELTAATIEHPGSWSPQVRQETSSPPATDSSKGGNPQPPDSRKKPPVTAESGEGRKQAAENTSKVETAAKPTPKNNSLTKTEGPPSKTTTLLVEEPKIERWGSLTGSAGDCRFRADADGLTIAIPATLHILSPDLKTKNAPRLLTAVKGDFQAQVRVVGRILPGTKPLPDLPFTFQGAGLLIWEDQDNYLRLERSASYSSEGKTHLIFVEYCRDGKLAPIGFRESREGDTLVRVDRKGSEVRCSYSPDEGKNWLEVKRQSVNFPAQLQIGVSAANASTKPFSARLEAFQLSGPGVKAGKGP